MNYKEILIFVAGTTPQIITETIYALSQKTPALYPDEIFIITTSTGRKRIEDTLLKQGVLKGLVKEYSLPDIKLTEDSFIIVRDAAGREIDDIKDESENEDYKNLCGHNPAKAVEWRDKWSEDTAFDSMIRQNICKINDAISDSLGDSSILPYYIITPKKRYGDTPYGIRVDKGKIRIE